MKQEVKLTVKMLAFVMALLILIVSLPVSAFATVIGEEASNTSTDNLITNADIESESTIKDVIVLEEDEALREENIKHFKLSDGTTKAVVYSQAVHYKDADGKWVDINNALTLNGSEYSTGNKSEIKFANKSGSSGLVSIKDGDYKIDFTPLNTNKVSAVIENSQSNNSRKFEDMSVLNNLVSKAIYENIYDGIDIEYILVGNNIKENIIVKEKQDSYTFSFELKLNKLSAELVNGAILLSDIDSGEQVYKIPAPYMLDANNAYSNSVEYTLTQNSKWKYTLTVTASADWINASDRAFPVAIDPTIGVDEDYITDYTYDASTTETTLKVGNGNKAYIELKTLPYLPKDSFVIAASLGLYAMTAGNNYIGVYENETTTLEDYNQILTTGEYTWDISRPLYNWYDNGASSGKIRLETISGTGESKFYSMENSSGGHPAITISYRDMKGLESYWTYASQNVGIAGTGNVNLKTGNLVFTIPTLTTTDSLFGFTPTLIYDSALAGESYINGNAQIANPLPYMPYGFKLNMQETILKKTYLNKNLENETYYVWSDADGTEHCFFQSNEVGKENIYYDRDGLQCKLIVDTSSSTSSCTLIDSNYNERTFIFLDYGLWYLSKITDKNGNALNYRYTFVGNYPKPESVKVTPNGSSAIEMLTFEYYSSDMPCLIYNPSSGRAVLLKYSSTIDGVVGKNGSYLREIQYIHCDIGTTLLELKGYANGTNTSLNVVVDATASYEYDENGKLIKSHDELQDYSVEYTTNYYTGKINTVREYGRSQTQGQSISITYYRGYTEVKTSGSDDVLGTSDDLRTSYTFDAWGRLVSSYTTNLDSSEVYGGTTVVYESENTRLQNSLKQASVVKGNSANYVFNGNFEWDETNVKWWTLSDNTEFCSSSYDVDWDNSYLKLSVSANETAFAKQETYLGKGTYTISFDVDAYATPNLTIYLKAISNTNTYVEKIPVNEVHASGSNGFASFTFEVTEEAETEYNVGIYLEGNSLIEDEEYITIDNVMLAKTTGMSAYNLVNFGDAQYQYFDMSLVNEWLGHLTEVDAGYGRSLYLEGEIDQERKAYQTIYTAPQSAIDSYFDMRTVTTGEDTIFTLSGYAKCISAIAVKKAILL